MELLDGDNIELGHIKASHPETKERCKVMFEKWLLKHTATWDELISALEKVKLTYLALNIKKHVLSIIGNFLTV